MRIKRKGTAGFTLVEVLVSLALISVISGLMLLVVSQFRVLTLTKDRLSAQQDLDAVAHYISRSLEHIERIPVERLSNGASNYVDGSKNSIRYVGVVRVGAVTLGLRDVEYFLRINAATDSGFELIESRKFRRSQDSLAQLEIKEVTIGENITSLGFSYLQTDESESKWLTFWSKPNRLPSKIGVFVESVVGGRTYRSRSFAMIGRD